MNYTEIEIEGMKEILRDKEKEIKKLKESLDIATKCSCKEEDGIIRLSEENNKLKLHIEAKDKAYVSLLKDYEEIKEKNKELKSEIEEWLENIEINIKELIIKN